MTDDIQRPDQALQQLLMGDADMGAYIEALEKAVEDNPKLKVLAEKTLPIAERIKSGDLNMRDAMLELAQLALDPEVTGMLSEEDFMSRPTGHNIATIDSPPDFQDPSASLFQPNPERLPQGHPLYMTRVMERLQFDGDAPELRHGPMPRQSTPAVPVETDALNPVAVGAMLSTASGEVQHALESNVNEAAALTIEEPEVDRFGNLVKASPGKMTIRENPSTDPAGYERGKVPALRQVSAPNASALANLSDEDRQKFAFAAVGTTQGRRSGLSALRSHLTTRLSEDGFEVVSGDAEGEALASAEWTMTIMSRKLQPSFSPLASAISALHAHLVKEVPEGGSVILQVGTVDRYSDRQVGWSASLYRNAQ